MAAVLDLLRRFCERPDLPVHAPCDLNENSDRNNVKLAGSGLWPPYFGPGLRV